MLRWRIAILVSIAIAVSYLDRQTLPWTIKTIESEYTISNSVKAFLDSAFLITYGLMYLGGGRLLDYLGTRRGFLLIMIFWSLACASHGAAADYGMSPVFGLSFAVIMLASSRLLLGMGEGGGFPAATRAVAEWFPVTERSTAMGIINGGTAVGAVLAPWLIRFVLDDIHWFGLEPWRWVFIITGVLGLAWSLWWVRDYRPPEQHPRASARELAYIEAGQIASADAAQAQKTIPLLELLSHVETWAVVGAKFLTDAAWYFYMFWLPKFLMETFHYDFNAASSVGWIPYAASGVGCLLGGGLSSWMLSMGLPVNLSRKIALGLSAAFMPWVIFVPHIESIGWVIFIFSLAFFGQQSWSTLVMILPTDMIPRKSLGTVAGLVGLGGALGGVLLGQIAGYLRDHHYSFAPVLYIAGSLHLAAFILICVVIPRIQPLNFSRPTSP